MNYFIKTELTKLQRNVFQLPDLSIITGEMTVPPPNSVHISFVFSTSMFKKEDSRQSIKPYTAGSCSTESSANVIMW